MHMVVLKEAGVGLHLGLLNPKTELKIWPLSRFGLTLDSTTCIKLRYIETRSFSLATLPSFDALRRDDARAPECAMTVRRRCTRQGQRPIAPQRTRQPSSCSPRSARVRACLTFGWAETLFFLQAIEQDPTQAKYFDARCAAYDKLGRIKPALLDARQVIRLAPQSHKVRSTAGASLKTRG